MGLNQGPISLDQKYTQETGHIFLTGTQALVRLPMAQIRRDRAAGLNTAGFISGYRGSPLGGYDQQLRAARTQLDAARHQVPARPQRRPRRDRGLGHAATQPVARRAVRWRVRHLVRQGAGRRPHRRCVQARQCRRHRPRMGGVLCLAGDDHGAKSSTVPHQSEHAFVAALMPSLYPSIDPRDHRATACSAWRCRAIPAAGSA